MSIRTGRREAASENGVDGAPVFASAGIQASGEFHCADCGYGIALRRELPVCPMCGGGTWEEAAFSPIGHATSLPLD